MTGAGKAIGEGAGAGSAAARPRGAGLRMLAVHRWLGRVVMLYFTLIFTTGTLLVFAPELQALMSPQMQRHSAVVTAEVNWPGLLDTAIAQYPEAQPLILRAPQSALLAGAVEMQHPGRGFVVWADPGTAVFQGVTPARGLHEILRLLHTHLMLDRKLMLILVSLTSLLLIAQIVAGLRSTPRFWRNWGRPPPMGVRARAMPRSLWGGLHRWVAVWSLPLLVVVATTALIYLAEAVGFEQTLPAAQPTARTHEFGLPAGFDGADLARALSVAATALPGLEVREIYLPIRAGEGVRIRGDLTALLVRPRANTVTVDPDDFSVLGVHRGEELSIYRRVMELADPLHFGTFGGMPTRVLWAAMGVLATGLALSGLMIAAWRTSPVPDAPSPRAAVGAIFGPARLVLAATFLFVISMLIFTLFLQGS